MYCSNIQELYKNGTINEVLISDNSTTTLKVQSNSSIIYSVVGKLRDDMDYISITGIKDNGLSTVSTISDNGVYSFDVTGYCVIKIATDANSDGVVLAKIYGER